MKRFALMLIVALWPGIAAAQVGPEVYRISTPAQISAFTVSQQYSAMTAASLTQMLEVTCQTAACFIWINASGQSYPASTATGVYLPVDTPRRFLANRGSKVHVIGAAAGTIHIQELTK